MCGRFTIINIMRFVRSLNAALNAAIRKDDQIDEQQDILPDVLDDPGVTQDRYNISPGQILPVIRRDDGLPVMHELKWGYDHPRIKKLVFNAKSESIHKGMFGPSFKNRRCLVPASGFYDWDEYGQCYWFRLKTQKPFCFAGVWDKDRFAFATVEPNAIVRPIHHRMPVMLTTADQWGPWLDRPAHELLIPLPPDLMETYPVEGFGKRDSPLNIQRMKIPPMPTLFG